MNTGKLLSAQFPEVVLTCNYSPWSRYSGGAQKSVHMIADEMIRQGVNVAVVYSKAPWEKVPVPAGLAYPIRWAWFLAFRSGISSPLRFLNGISFFFAVRRLSGPNTVVHGNGDEASLIGLIRNKRGFIYTNRYPVFPNFLFAADWSKPLTWIRILLREPRFVAMALGMRFADKVTVTSDFSVGQVRDCFGIVSPPAKVVPNGVDSVFLDTPLSSREQHGVVFFGRLTHAKGADLLLEAYALLAADIQSSHPLKIIGQGPLKRNLENRVKELGLSCVSFHAWKFGAELAQDILNCKVVCLPSREESFGNTVVEALALGQQVVTSRAGSIPEVAGPYGILIPGENPKDLADALEVELRNERSKAEGLNQREYIRSKYSWSGSVYGFRQVYQGLQHGA